MKKLNLKKITEYPNVLEPRNVAIQKSPICAKMVNMQRHATENRVPVQDVFLSSTAFKNYFEPQYLYLCRLHNITPHSDIAAKNIQLRWNNSGDKSLPITVNTVGWHGPMAQLKNKYTQKTVEQQFITAGYLHQHMFSMRHKNGAKLTADLNIKLPYVNQKKLKMFQVNMKNVSLFDRQVSIQKNRHTGLYEFKEWDPYYDPRPEAYHELTPMIDVISGIVNKYEAENVNRKLNRNDRFFTNIINTTAHKQLADLMRGQGISEVDAFRELKKNNPDLVSFADLDGSISIAELAKKINYSRARMIQYKMVDHYGFPVAQDGVNIAQLDKFFTRYKRGSIAQAIYHGRPLYQAGKKYYISKMSDMSKLPSEIEERNVAIERSFKAAENLLRPHLNTTMSKTTVQVYGLTLCRFTVPEISDILQIAPSDVEKHYNLADSIFISGTATPPSHTVTAQAGTEVIDRSLYAFGKLPQMKDYVGAALSSFHTAPVQPKTAP